jgi:hypothetical protein
MRGLRAWENLDMPECVLPVRARLGTGGADGQALFTRYKRLSRMWTPLVGPLPALFGGP